MNTVIYFLNGNGDSIQQHYFQKEYRDDVVIEYEGLFYEVYFFTENSIKYEMRNDGFFSFPGMIILEEISNGKIIVAIKELAGMGYFTCFNGMSEMPFNTRFIQKWYANDLNLFNSKSIASITI